MLHRLADIAQRRGKRIVIGAVVLAVVAGSARVALGGPNGQVVTVRSGDVLVLPAGTGHCNLGSDGLRTVGAYLDAKGVELVELHKRPISITLSYRDKEGHQQGEDRTVSSFYNLFLELYGKRGQQKTLTVKHPNSQPSALTS